MATSENVRQVPNTQKEKENRTETPPRPLTPCSHRLPILDIHLPHEHRTPHAHRDGRDGQVEAQELARAHAHALLAEDRAPEEARERRGERQRARAEVAAERERVDRAGVGAAVCWGGGPRRGGGGRGGGRGGAGGRGGRVRFCFGCVCCVCRLCVWGGSSSSRVWVRGAGDIAPPFSLPPTPDRRQDSGMGVFYYLSGLRAMGDRRRLAREDPTPKFNGAPKASPKSICALLPLLPCLPRPSASPALRHTRATHRRPDPQQAHSQD